jgi:hypothetical protein
MEEDKLLNAIFTFANIDFINYSKYFSNSKIIGGTRTNPIGGCSRNESKDTFYLIFEYDYNDESDELIHVILRVYDESLSIYATNSVKNEIFYNKINIENEIHVPCYLLLDEILHNNVENYRYLNDEIFPFKKC